MKQFISLEIHAQMVADPVRMGTYRKAIHEVVQSGDVVVDLGAGTGVLTAFACQAGAARVYVVERLPTISLARAMIQDMGWADRVVFIEKDFTLVDLPEQVDVMISEVLGSFGIGETAFSHLVDCRKRMLKPGGRMIPARINLFAAPVTDPGFYDRIAFKPAEASGIDLSAAAEVALNQTYGHQVAADQYLAPAQRLAEMDFYTLTPTRADQVEATLQFLVDQSGDLHGFVGWFEADLSDQVRLSNQRYGQQNSWYHHFFPLEQPVSVEVGDTVQLDLRMDYAGMAQFVWMWQTRVVRKQAGTEVEIARFQQNTFRGQLFSKNLMRMSKPDYVPELTPEGKLARQLLSYIDGERDVEMLTRLIQQAPDMALEDPDQDVGRMLRRAWLINDIS